MINHTMNIYIYRHFADHHSTIIHDVYDQSYYEFIYIYIYRHFADHHSTACKGSFISSQGAKKCFHSKGRFVTDDTMHGHGWNMRFFNSPHTIVRKLRYISDHHSIVDEARNIDIGTINYRIYNGMDLFNRGKSYDLEYRSADELQGPWFYMANRKYRPAFHRYGKATDKTAMDTKPHCLALQEVTVLVFRVYNTI